jgi:hypothetical protein
VLLAVAADQEPLIPGSVQVIAPWRDSLVARGAAEAAAGSISLVGLILDQLLAGDLSGGGFGSSVRDGWLDAVRGTGRFRNGAERGREPCTRRDGLPVTHLRPLHLLAYF